jgi:glycosyltransferase involved in cell wall biosynthesis
MRKGDFMYMHRYSDYIYGEKVFVLGINPPPYGGMSVHVQRVSSKLKAQSNTVFLEDSLIGYKKHGFFYYFLLMYKIVRFKPDIIIYNTISLHAWPIELCILVILKMFFRYKLLVIHHVNRFLPYLSIYQRRFLGFLFKFVSQQIFIGNSTYEAFLGSGFKVCDYSIEAAFLPPLFESESHISCELEDFILKNRPVLFFNASKFELYKGKDLYGLDLMIEAFNFLKKKYDVSLILAISGYNEKLFEPLMCQIEDRGSVYLIANYENPVWPILKRCNIFIRPTRCDAGYSISLQEALFFKVASIASDVSERPAGTILFEDGNVNDLILKLEEVIINEKIKISSYNSYMQ